MKILNTTPHAINIISGAEFNPEIRKFQGGNIANTIAPSGTLVSAKSETRLVDENPLLPIYENNFVDVDILPDGYDIYIVSVMYASACVQLGRDTSKLYTVHGLVVDQDGQRPIGCLGLQKFS